MPPEKRKPQEIEAVRKRILEAALDILANDGFESLSMRRIASRTSMTATNIYYYFRNKDHIYLEIQATGFTEMAERFLKIDESDHCPLGKLRLFMWEYIDFGIANPDMYAIMFTLNTPKYADYVGTDLEEAATNEKQMALQVADITMRIIEDITRSDPALSRMDPYFETLRLWTTVHGIVSLINSRVLQEVEQDIVGYFRKTVDHYLGSFAPASAGAAAMPEPGRDKPRRLSAVQDKTGPPAKGPGPRLALNQTR